MTASKNNFFMFVTVILIWRVFWILYTIVMKIQAYTSENGWTLEMLIFVLQFNVDCTNSGCFDMYEITCVLSTCTESHIRIFIPWASMRGRSSSDIHMKINVLADLFSLSKNHQVKWGLDLQSEHERYITEVALGGRPVIIRDYPKVCSVQFWVLIIVLKQSIIPFHFH